MGVREAHFRAQLLAQRVQPKVGVVLLELRLHHRHRRLRAKLADGLRRLGDVEELLVAVLAAQQQRVVGAFAQVVVEALRVRPRELRH